MNLRKRIELSPPVLYRVVREVSVFSYPRPEAHPSLLFPAWEKHLISIVSDSISPVGESQHTSMQLACVSAFSPLGISTNILPGTQESDYYLASMEKLWLNREKATQDLGDALKPQRPSFNVWVTETGLSRLLIHDPDFASRKGPQVRFSVTVSTKKTEKLMSAGLWGERDSSGSGLCPPSYWILQIYSVTNGI